MATNCKVEVSAKAHIILWMIQILGLNFATLHKHYLNIGDDNFVIVDVFRIFEGEVDNLSYRFHGTNNVQVA